MNSAQTVTNKIANWKTEGHSKVELLVLIAEACLGWPYVWGGYGQYCTPANRKSYANRDTCPSGEAEEIRRKCQALNGSKSGCDGCGFYPSAVVRFFDCRGFTRWVLAQIGIDLKGAGATSQWNTESNWSQKGLIADMPEGAVCCLFNQNQKDHKTMEHTGFCVGGGQVIHCSGTVKRGKITDKGWTHYAIPKGLEGDTPMPDTKPTLRRGSKGEYVTLLQTMLIQRGYDVGRWGADGAFGAATESAVKLFQTDHGLPSDGIVGANTWAALESGEKELYTVTIQHVSRSVADEIIKKFGGTMTKE
jgi:cell wall-associated NlpC family hydrolase